MLYQEAKPRRGHLWARPEAGATRRACARPRRTRSEDSRAESGFIEETLEEIRRKRHSSSARLTDTEIDQLLSTLRRQDGGPGPAAILGRYQ